MSKDEIIQVSVRIDGLRREIARIGDLQRELRTAERQLDVLLGLVADTSAADSDDSLMARVIGMLDANPSRDYDADELLAEWPQENIASIRSALSRASSPAVGKIARSTRGRYRSNKGSDQQQPTKELELVA